MRKKKTQETLASIKNKALPILKKHDVKRAAVFGSFAHGTATSRSDVDFLIEYKGKHKSLFDLVDLKLELEETFGRKVDVITYNSIYWALRDRILAEQVVIL
jgi:predicted nucleotidyltransferase